MNRKDVLIIGGGITGLSLAFFLKKRFENSLNITLLESSNRLGGMIQTVETDDFLFEQGPRSLRSEEAKEVLNLIDELSLSDQVIYPDKVAYERFLLIKGKLIKVPKTLFQLISSKLTRKHLFTFVKECFQKVGSHVDESVYDFFSRRFSKEVTTLFIDAMVKGVYAGDIHKLSMRACFPKVFQWEKEYGSVIKGAFSERKPSYLFGLKKGMGQLVQALEKQLKDHIKLNACVHQIEVAPKKIIVKTKDQVFKVDHLFSTVPSYVLANVFPDEKIKILLNKIKYAPLDLLNLGYQSNVIKNQSFGYLIPQTKGPLFGVVFDSCVFPKQQKKAEGSVLTLIGRNFPNNQKMIEKVSKDLNISKLPCCILKKSIEKAIPQYEVGHLQKVHEIVKSFEQITDRITLLGTWMEGVSISDCVTNAKKIATSWNPMFTTRYV